MSESLNLPPQQPTVLSFRGPDAIRFLNGQITQDVSDLDDRALPACVTDAKGRLQFFVRVFAGPDVGSLWVTCPKDQSEGLRDRLERYLIADDVEVDDLTDQWNCVHASHSDASSAFSRRARGCFGAGYDSWWRSDKLPQIKAITEGHAERLRIAERIPVWGSELRDGMLPPEAGLDRSSISYAKGCYIGQEVLSRIKTAGKLNRRLAAFNIEGTAAAGDLLKMDSKEVGQLTSCTAQQALGYLKKAGFEESQFPLADAAGTVTGTAVFAGWA